MSILIKGMEMPKSCAKCKLFGEYGCPFIGAVGYALTRGERNEDCPLVPVPPHGRCIDADELLGLVYANIALFDSTPGRLGADQKLVRAWLSSMAEDINDAPTIIPAEEGE